MRMVSLCGSPCCSSGLECLFSCHLLPLEQTPYLILQTQARFTFSVKCSMSMIALPICFHRILFIKLLLTITCLYSLLDWGLFQGRNQFFSFKCVANMMYVYKMSGEWMNERMKTTCRKKGRKLRNQWQKLILKLVTVELWMNSQFSEYA